MMTAKIGSSFPNPKTSLRWKFKLRNVWGQSKRVFIDWRDLLRVTRSILCKCMRCGSSTSALEQAALPAFVYKHTTNSLSSTQVMMTRHDTTRSALQLAQPFQLTLCKTASARWLTATAAAMAAVSAGSVIAAASAAIATAGASADTSAVCAAPLRLLAVTGSGSWGLGLLEPAAAASCLQWKTSDGQIAVE